MGDNAKGPSSQYFLFKAHGKNFSKNKANKSLLPKNKKEFINRGIPVADPFQMFPKEGRRRSEKWMAIRKNSSWKGFFLLKKASQKGTGRGLFYVLTIIIVV
jgi:hypothetical protein